MVEKKKKLTPFDYIKSINTKKYIEDVSKFNVYLTMQYFASDKAFVSYVDMLNVKDVHKMPKKAIYDFFFQIIPKSPRRFLKMEKKPADEETIALIMRWFKVNNEVAKMYVENIKEPELNRIRTYFKSVDQ